MRVMRVMVCDVFGECYSVVRSVVRWLVRASAVGLVVKYLVANEMPRVRFPDGAFSYAALLFYYPGLSHAPFGGSSVWSIVSDRVCCSSFDLEVVCARSIEGQLLERHRRRRGRLPTLMSRRTVGGRQRWSV